MPSQNAIRFFVAPAILILVGALPGLHAWLGPRQALSQAGGQPAGVATTRPPLSADEKAIRAVDDVFTSSCNKGDIKALTALFTDDAEVVEADGSRFRGQRLIEQSFADTFSASKDVKIALDIESIELLSADAAKEEGRSLITPATGTPISRLYTVLFVKREGRWLITNVREEPDPLVRPHDRLKDLEWMVGDWIDEGADAVVRVHCQWSQDENFLFRTFTVKRQGKPVMSVSQRIGWDAVARRFRSWEFDSDGGFGEGTWSRDGERWIIKSSGVRPEGTTASATNIMFRERPDLVRWRSTDRVIGDESLPDDIGYVLVRVPPPPKAGDPPTTSSAKTTRSPK
jgi:uncharacterized protein (TIGR02246 family)